MKVADEAQRVIGEDGRRCREPLSNNSDSVCQRHASSRESPSPRVSGERVAEGRVRGTRKRLSSAALRHLLPAGGEKDLDYFTAPVVMPETK